MECPEMEGLNKYQKRGIPYYYSKKAKKGTIRLKKYRCVSGYQIGTNANPRHCWEENVNPHWCWKKNNCPECYEVRLMGIQIKMAQLRENPDAKALRCTDCNTEHSWTINVDKWDLTSSIEFKCPEDMPVSQAAKRRKIGSSKS